MCNIHNAICYFKSIILRYSYLDSKKIISIVHSSAVSPDMRFWNQVKIYIIAMRFDSDDVIKLIKIIFTYMHYTLESKQCGK